MFLLSCNKELEFYPLHPPEIYEDRVACFGRTVCNDSLRFDYIAVKNLNINNPQHLKEVDNFVAKNIAENYAKYTGYRIIILKYKKIMKNVCESGWGSGKWYSMWDTDYGLLAYTWEKGKFLDRMNLIKWRELCNRSSKGEVEMVIKDDSIKGRSVIYFDKHKQKEIVYKTDTIC